MEYLIRRAISQPSLQGEWDGPVWSHAEVGELTHFLPQSSDHHPRVHFRSLYDDTGIYVIFHVEDRYVRSVVTTFNGPVCRDSCTEFFVQPKEDAGYINFEINCGGTLLAYYIEDSRQVVGGFKKMTELTPEDAACVRIFHSMPSIVDPEVTEPTIWINECYIPFTLFERYLGPLGAPAGQRWMANFYKCADSTSHPHWATWAPVTGKNFHQPRYFAPIVFAK